MADTGVGRALNRGEYRINYRDPNAVSVNGVYMPKGRLIAENNGVMVLKFKGFTYTYGQGMTNYAPAETWVVQQDAAAQEGSYGIVKVLIKYNSRKK